MTLTDYFDNGIVSGRLWFYSNYHCNLACTYCLTESSPNSPKRLFSPEQMVSLAHEAKEMGFKALGITGGEPFLLPNIENTIAKLADILPITVLTNGTLFNPKRIKGLAQLSHREVCFQISLDSHLPSVNDSMRGPDNFAKVVEAVPKLIELGIQVRIASTLESIEDISKLKQFVANLGIPEQDHIVRHIVQRGRAKDSNLGTVAHFERFPPELTLTSEGAFWTPFGPTYRQGRLQTDLLICRTVAPLNKPVQQLLNILGQSDLELDNQEGFV
ncbi:MAG: radical SAM protein [Myxococcota bacterium]|nr:radical SAM protein [Myxococcota bacterium]